MTINIRPFFDSATNTLTYILFNNEINEAVIIDPVLNYDQASSSITDESVKSYVSFLEDNNLNLTHVFETHAHADHITGADLLKRIYPKVKTCIGEGIMDVQKFFTSIYNLKSFDPNGRQFDVLLKDDQEVSVLGSSLKVITTPGHTPACISLLIDGHLFTGDTLFMPDIGTGRCDFPGGSSKQLFDSIMNKLYVLPGPTKVYTGHDYNPKREVSEVVTSIKESKDNNIQIRENTTLDEFVSFRDSRDSTLNAPKLLYPSIQLNINGGKIPSPEDNGNSYLKIPLSISLN
ncbi:MAG: MBL fold metallo-hydrolase [Halobacteriovoraceae bacterium]|nr:MBL fold metallo-hydrolase [Halobacteriovoraceae bacterium]